MSIRESPSELKFFFDNNIARQIARGVAEFGKAQGIHVLHLTDKFDASALDVDWIPSLRSEGDWIIISADVPIIIDTAKTCPPGCGFKLPPKGSDPKRIFTPET